MPRMWRGRSERLRQVEADPLWAALHRRNGKLNISCNVDSETHAASFFRLEQGGGRCGTWFKFDLGVVEGPDPMFNCLWGSHLYTPVDAGLLDLHYRYVLQFAGEIDSDLHALRVKLASAIDEFLA